ncbi:MAG: peptide chain release factor 1 [Nitrospira sp.]|nr:peptide chain release factor 1 [Nitrospira sp.]
MEAALLKKWESVASRFHELTDQLMDPSVVGQPAQLRKLSKERTELEPAVTLLETYQSLAKQLEEAAQILADPTAGHELHRMAMEETAALEGQRSQLEAQAKEFLIPRDPKDDKNLVLEIRAGTGGEEAALFAGELFRLYTRYAEQKGLKVDTVEASETGIGGYKNIVALIEGKGAYGHFKFEAGVHRVQRVPVTEASGRIHTSTVTVAVMPEVDEVDVQIDPKDLRIDTFCSSGAGGQSVNTTYSAVRITHLPTGIVVSCQDERSQLKNRTKAMRTLRARIVEAEREKQEAEIAQSRKSQVGTGERSEKIRTYNFPQNRVTDHRVGVTLHKLELVMEGDLDDIVQALKAQQQRQVEAAPA